jgi:hypothetical protein
MGYFGKALHQIGKNYAVEVLVTSIVVLGIYKNLWVCDK